MKKIISLLVFGCVCSFALGQGTTESLVVKYKHSMKIPVSVNQNASDNIEQSADFTLMYSDGKSLYSGDKQAKTETMVSGMRVDVGMPEEITYKDFGSKTVVTQTDFFDKKFLITKNMIDNEWIITNEQKTIAGYSCTKATNSIGDVIWFSNEIPVPDGPIVFCGAPGLILEVVSRMGTTTAVSILKSKNTPKMDPPAEGKRVTEAEFMEIVRKRMEANGVKQGGLNVEIR
ncbi:GLPGLI family protein [Bacteroidia bacterium]|nr:GLPGLI family protein [Bacteroidia bacterium]